MKSGIKVKSGTEGPHHDPYGYTEVTVTNWTGRFTYHGGGLVEWCEVQFAGTKHPAKFNKNGSAGFYPREIFTKFVGMTPERATKAKRDCEMAASVRKHREHEMRCDGEPAWFAGYPGESLCRCQKCGTIFDTEFNISEVM